MANQVIELQSTDPRVGRRSVAGDVERWPDIDVFGQPYDTRVNMVRRNIEGGDGLFVLVPPQKESPELRVLLAGTLKAQMTEPPVESGKVKK